MASKTVSIEQSKAINAVLALLTAQREEQLGGDGAEPRRTEVVLASVGMTAPEIAPLVGKSTDAVAKAIQRARQPKKKAPRTRK